MFQALENNGTKFRRGQLVLVAAGPGTGKSAFVLTQVLKSKLPAMYFSADSDAFTQLTRSISIVSGWPLEQSAKAVLNDELGEVEVQLADAPLRLVYDASPSLDRIEESLAAYFEVYEDYPEIIVVDNVTNVRGDGQVDGDPFSGLEALMDYLHDMARQTQACVFGLHHVTGGYNDANKPIPLSGVKGQITRVPEMVLTLHKQKFDEYLDILCVSTVKNRGGKSDPSGETFAELEFIGNSMTIRDLSPGVQLDIQQSEDEDDLFDFDYDGEDPFND